ncbi:TonB-dependent receptor [Pseudoalteromonas sp. S16_S37]|uniref:TonB-dependent receptor n=1 Tax=Pseudoalteromonas sp. S16_S37 TaxID=2720228 RepID=UPI001680C97A|nr:TonB-dependent receptor [Pseudoalteromonas sp. S16_S37]MBD1583547.1 TonB-dependent receptor [Pseudoalteromonas sp. S16_S37]
MLFKKSLLGVSVSALLASVSHPVFADDLERIEIRAERIASDLNSIARNVSVIDEQTLRTQFASAQNIAEVLAKTMPGMAPPTPALTNFGTTLRGRNALVLIDGVPMNTNRNISRDLHNLHPAQVERVEVFRGGNALYGSGATGGVIYIYTKSGQQTAEIASSIEVKNGAFTLAQSFTGQVDDWQYRVGASYENVDSFSDAQGDRLAVEPSQGDAFDSDIYSFDAKVTKTWQQQQLSISLLSYILEQDTDYASDPSVKALPYIHKAQTIKGLQLDKQNEINNLVFNIGYQNQLSENNKLATQFYYRDYDARFAPFDGRPYATWNHLAQTYLESTNLGAKLTINSTFGDNIELDWGIDAQDERSEMPVTTYDGDVYDNSGFLKFKETGDKAFVPEISHRTIAAFVQARANITKQLGVEGGLRAERIDASFDDFTTLGQGVAISGSSYDYDSTVYNVGLTYDINDNHTVYVAFNEGYELPDIGLQIRYATSQFDLSQSSLQPIESRDRELGWRGAIGPLDFSAAYFVSKSDLGGVKSEGMGLSVSRNEVKIDGFEVTSSWAIKSSLNAEFSYSKANGDEKAQNAEQFQQMNGFSIAPSKLTAQLNYDINSNWRTNLTLMKSGSKDYRLAGKNAFGRREVQSYTLVDFNSQIDLEQGTVTVGIENLFNNQYFPVYSQLQRNGNNTSSIPGRGRTFSVNYRMVW